MDALGLIADNIVNSYANPILRTTLVAAVLLVVAALSLYEFIVYRVVSHRAFYSKSFNISIAVLPFFISTIILCLQSNLVITLGTIGALAIIRFRTAVKDPVDMIYLLWSLHIGIACGCQLYEVAVLTSLAVTIVLVALNYFSLGRRPYLLVFHCGAQDEEQIQKGLGETVKKYRVKSRNYTPEGVDYVAECSVKDPGELTALMRRLNVERFSVIEYDSEDIV